MEKIVEAWVRQVLEEVSTNFKDELMFGLQEIKNSDQAAMVALEALYSVAVGLLDLRKQTAEAVLDKANLNPDLRAILRDIADIEYTIVDIRTAFGGTIQ